MRLAERVTIRASAQAVWDYLDDPAHQLTILAGVTRWEIAGEQPTGAGARYRVLMRVGAAELGGLVEVVEYDPPCDLAWTSVTGVDQRGRWRLRERELGRTEVELRLSYGVAGGGPLGWLAEQVAAPTVRSNLRRSLQQLAREVEHEERRRAAARRSGLRG